MQDGSYVSVYGNQINKKTHKYTPKLKPMGPSSLLKTACMIAYQTKGPQTDKL